MKTWLLHGYESSKLWVRIILALGTNHLNFGYESSGYETSVGTKRPVSVIAINSEVKAVVSWGRYVIVLP